VAEGRTVLSKLARRLSASDVEVEAEELRDESLARGATEIKACSGGDRVHVSGTLRTVTLRPRDGVPALEAELYDGSATLKIVWLGRRRIVGLEPGRTLTAYGRICSTDGARAMFNPSYELMP
jgi:hypothetical protein